MFLGEQIYINILNKSYDSQYFILGLIFLSDFKRKGDV